MGSLTDNLLKLTEFPFSYSFVGLLAVIFGQGWNFGDEEFFNRLGPLLILMGFVATTLSIIDPIGSLQKLLLRGVRSESDYSVLKAALPGESSDKLDYWNISIFGTDHLEWSVVILSAFRYSFEGTGSRYISRQGRPPERQAKLSNLQTSELTTLDKLSIIIPLLSLRDLTLKTTWVVREIDKITSMIYFIIVIVTFMLALVFVPSFEERFVVTLQGGNRSGGESNTITGSSRIFEQIPQEQQQLGQSVQTATPATRTGTNTVITEITGNDLVIHHIIAAISATKAGYASTAIIEINAALEVLNELEERGSIDVRIILFVFSYFALWAILYMLYRRLRHLRTYAATAFLYLLTRQAYLISRRLIKFESETFDKSLQEVEQYLTNGDWTLATFSVSQIKSDFENLIIENEQSGEDRGTGVY